MAHTHTQPALDRPFPILLIEDNADYQFLLTYCLQTAIPQARPTFFSMGSKALEFLNEVKSRKVEFPKLVFLDIFLPTPEVGWQVLTTIRLDYPTLPVIVLSAFQDQDFVKQAYDLGAHSFLAKPANFKDLMNDFQTLYAYWTQVVTLPLPH